MSQADEKPNPETSADEEACDPCEPKTGRPGPVREGGGTIGAGNLSPDQANRTGGATGGVDNDAPPTAPPRHGVTPDA